jgi:predicted nucleotidyltransferase
MTFKSLLRMAVLKTNAHWPFTLLNPMPYSWAISQFVKACQYFPEIRSVYLRHALVQGQWTPGLSDIDLTVIIDWRLARAEEFAFLAAFWKRIGRLQRVFPMLGEIEILSEAHLDSWTRFGFEGRGAWNWELLHGEETLSKTPRPVTTGLAQDAFDFAFWFYLHNVTQVFNSHSAPRYLSLQDLLRLKRKISRCMAAIAGSDAMDGPSAPEARSDAPHILVTILAMLEKGLVTAGLAAGSAQAPDARQQWLLRRAGGHAGTGGKTPMADEFANCGQVIRAVYLDMQQQPYVIVRDNFSLAANCPCIDQVKRYFAAQDLQPVILTDNLFAYLLRGFAPHSYARFIKHATLAFGEPCFDELGPPAEEAWQHELLRQVPLLLMFPYSQGFMSPGWLETCSPGILEVKLYQALALKLYLDQGIVKPGIAGMIPEYEARYPAQAEEIRKLRASLKDPKTHASSWEWFVFLKGLADEIHAALSRNED